MYYIFIVNKIMILYIYCQQDNGVIFIVSFTLLHTLVDKNL